VLMAVLENSRRFLQALIMFLILVELCPAQLPSRVSFPEGFFAQKSPLSARLEKDGTPVLPWVDTFNASYQTYSVQSWVPMAGGYSGKAILNAALLYRLIAQHPHTEHEILEILAFTRFERLLTFNADDTALMEKMPFLRKEGCYKNFEQDACIFDMRFGSLQKNKFSYLDLSLDTAWEYSLESHEQVATLRAKKIGMLDYKSFGSCAIESRLYVKGVPLFTQYRPFGVPDKVKISFHENEEIFVDRSQHWLFRLPSVIRPERRNRIVCTQL